VSSRIVRAQDHDFIGRSQGGLRRRRTRFLQHRHEHAYPLAKGHPPVPARPQSDVRDWDHTGNRLHPTQKPLALLEQLVQTFSKPGDLILDHFCGSGSSLEASRRRGRDFLGIDSMASIT
jgi:site-specific DNA-methyltransferase (adenine-specific)